MKKSQAKTENTALFSLKKWLTRGSAPKQDGICQADPETASLTAVRILSSRLKGRKGVLAAASASEAENLCREISVWNRTLGLSLSAALLPEGICQGSTVAEDESPRAEALARALSADPPDLFVGSVNAFLAPVPDPDEFAGSEIFLKKGDTFRLTELADKLVVMGYDDEPEASVTGEFARRGGILDVYSPGMRFPARIEFFGDEIDSIREYSPDTGRSVREIESVRILARSGTAQTQPGETDWKDFSAYLRQDSFLLILDPSSCFDHLEKYGGSEALTRWELFRSRCPELAEILYAAEAAERGAEDDRDCQGVVSALAGISSGDTVLDELENSLSMEFVRRHLSEGWRIVLAASKESDREHFSEWIKRAGLEGAPGLAVEDLVIPSGVMLTEEKTIFIAERELFPAALKRAGTLLPREEEQDPEKTAQEELEQMADIEEGDIVVHLNQGICRFRGLVNVTTGAGTVESLELEFADDMICYVPVWQAHLVSRYIGAKASVTKLSRLNSSRWGKMREDAAFSARNLALEMLRIQAVRSMAKGDPFPGDGMEQRVFEDSFPFEPTAGQVKASEEIKRDMESSKPMDRLLCGDVGYGKTEVAMRAAFKCVSGGRQVAVLVPTTVLARQHYLSFRERFAEYPFLIESISRLKTASEKREIYDRIASGRLDIIIGTHALLSKEVRFKNLGLVIIDEEQKFGVEHKDKLKAARMTVDVLTMTATPIPRTLHMSMTGLRDLSAITTAPVRRLPIHTIVAQYDESLIKAAVCRELERGGQVFYLYNRVRSIDNALRRIQAMVPGARVEAAHGQMRAGELEDIMGRFVEKQIDVLVCTTIIESGVDIPNVNTIIIERADTFGLAELHQLRGRVGRWNRQAYAVMLLPPNGIMTTDARERMSVIRKYTHLGSGFRLALNDLRIRGAGNIIGAEQSGHVDNIGFHLYCQLLREAAHNIQGLKTTRLADADLSLEFLAFAGNAPKGKLSAVIPPSYIGEERLRLDAYRKAALLTDEESLDDFAAELRDKYGPLPDEVKNFLASVRLRIVTSQLGYMSLSVRDGIIFLENKEGFYRRNGVAPRLPASFTPKERLEMLGVFLKQVRMEKLSFSSQK